MSEDQWDVIVVGGGTAGLSAALMLGRARRRVVVLDAGQPRNGVSAHMHGVLGRDGTSPLALLEDGRREVEGYGVLVRTAVVSGVTRSEDGGFEVELESGDLNGERVRAPRLVVTTGLRDQLPEIEGLQEWWGRGVAVCPYCDAWEVRDRRIGVIATGPFSPHHAQLIRQWSADLVYLGQPGVELGDDERSGLLARGVRVDDRGVRRVLSADGRLTGVEMADGDVIGLDTIFLVPDSVPSDTLLTRLGVDRSEMFGGSWVSTDGMGQTSVPRVWAAGNVVTPQANVPVAMATGAMVGGAVNADILAEEILQARAAMSTV